MKCPLCSPAAEWIVFQTELVLALWEPDPLRAGHLLVIPRRHLAGWFEASRQEQSALLEALDRARELLDQRFQPDGYHIETLAPAHLQLHLIPRYRDKPGLPSGINREQRLITGDRSDPLLPHLLRRFEQAVQVDIAVGFVLGKGWRHIYEGVSAMLQRPHTRFRLLTGDTLGITEPEPLRSMLNLQAFHPQQTQFRVFLGRGQVFHPKAYLFHDRSGKTVAYVGSSNLSESALTTGIEWNYLLWEQEEARVAALAFERLFHHTQALNLSHEWIGHYALRRQPRLSFGGASLAAEVELLPEPVEVPLPTELQSQALKALEVTRREGNQAGLVVLATGLGKTYLAAFDSASFERVLFVAHREEILRQARETFERVRPAVSMGLYTGAEKQPDAQILFASVATLSRERHLHVFQRNSFDYIIIDEFHHASAPTYDRVLQYFQPRFLLGLTATPERSDGGDLLGLCAGNLVFRCDLADGMQRGRLAPLHYFGVPDLIDYQNIPWRNGRFDPAALEREVAVEARAANSLEHYRQLAGSRTLVFCCSQLHARFMRDYFNRHGVAAAAVYSAPGSDSRLDSLERLAAGHLKVICCVDMFNEGIDLPAIDTVMMLRPTESRILWLQQLGRGLRLAPGKEFLRVIDYVGNHRVFLSKMDLLNSLTSQNVALRKRLEDLRARLPLEGLPPGCEVTYQPAAIDLLLGLLKHSPRDALAEYYHDFQLRHGRRPLACEAYFDGYNPRATRRRWGGWFGFVEAQGEVLSPAIRSWLWEVETVALAGPDPLIVLLALIGLERFPGTVSMEDLTLEFAKVAGRNRRNCSVDLSDLARLHQHLLGPPIQTWISRSYFAFDGSLLSCQLPPSDGLTELTQELVRWRLAEFFDRARPGHGFHCRVLQTAGRPILMFKRENHPDIPTGWTNVLVDGQSYEANFVKIAVNVIRRPGQRANVLPELLVAMFGPHVGKPGTRFEVEFSGAPLEMKPVLV